jgi:hypothetical protein
MNTLQRLQQEHGQSPWIDFVDRELIESGKLARLIDDGIRGLTSNPTIFAKAVASAQYDELLRVDRRRARAGERHAAVYGWASWRCSRSPCSCSLVCTCSCCRMPPSGPTIDQWVADYAITTRCGMQSVAAYNLDCYPGGGLILLLRLTTFASVAAFISWPQSSGGLPLSSILRKTAYASLRL